MSGDYSRRTDRTEKRFAAPLLQQGRVHLDSDWNELVDGFLRRARVQAADTFGPGPKVPATTQDGFKIAIPSPAPNPLDATIGAGRLWVDGLLAEAFADERPGGSPLSYLHQPYYPAPAPLGPDGLLYLDVWQREVTYLEDRDLLEVALGDGIDTTTRLQTVWQVKFAGPPAGGGAPPDCSANLDALDPPSAGLLSTRAVQAASPDDPCLSPATGGYRGVENRLYRVEIHDGGDASSATFKWSRENASVASAVQRIDLVAGVHVVTVERIGRDPILRFHKNDWVEVQDDRRELMGQPGLMARVAAVAEQDRALTLDRAFPTGTFDAADPARHTRVKRWDQQAGVAGTSGVVPAASAGTWFPLEDGVEVMLALDAKAAVQRVRPLDTWSFAARTADASVEVLVAAPPQAILHRHAPLATLAGGAVQGDCRTRWPPQTGTAACECVCVTAEQHNTGAFTIQDAVAQVTAAGGGRVCLGAGTFALRQPVDLSRTRALTLSGAGAATVLRYTGPDAAIILDTTGLDVVQDLTIDRNARERQGDRPLVGIRVSTSNALLAIRRCVMVVQTTPRVQGDGAGILLSGIVVEARLEENTIAGVAGVAVPAAPQGQPSLVAAELAIERNTLLVAAAGVATDAATVFVGRSVVRGNFVAGATLGGLVLAGVGVQQQDGMVTALEVDGNALEVTGAGVVVAASARITGNQLTGAGPAAPAAAGAPPSGVLIAPGLLSGSVFQVEGNWIVAFPGMGVELAASAALLEVRGNLVVGMGGPGIGTSGAGGAGLAAIEDNTVVAVSRTPSPIGAGIGLGAVSTAARIVGNEVAGVFPGSVITVGIAAAGTSTCALRITGNRVESVSSTSGDRGLWAGIAALAPFASAEVESNTVALASAERDGFVAILVGVTAGGVAGRHTVTIGEGPAARRFVVTHDGAIAAAAPVEDAGVRGNVATVARTSAAALSVGVTGAAIAAENRVTVGQGLQGFAATVQARTAIASANRIDCGPGARGDLAITAGATAAGLPLATVLGNVVRTGIQLNGGALPAAMQPLNVVTG